MRFNILPSHRHLTQTGTALLFMLVVLLAFLNLSNAHAELKNELQVNQIIQGEALEKVSVSLTREAWMDAGEYAKNHSVVAFSVSGHAKDATTQQIAEYLKAQLTSASVPNVYFTGHEERLGAAVSFFLKDMAYGPSGISGIQKNLKTVVRHFPQAWPEHKFSASKSIVNKIK